MHKYSIGIFDSKLDLGVLELERQLNEIARKFKIFIKCYDYLYDESNPEHNSHNVVLLHISEHIDDYNDQIEFENRLLQYQHVYWASTSKLQEGGRIHNLPVFASKAQFCLMVF